MQILSCDFILISIFVEDTVIERVNILHLLLDVAFDIFIWDTVCSSHSERVRREPVIDDSLRDSNKFVSCIRANL